MERGRHQSSAARPDRWRTTPVALKTPEQVEGIRAACAVARGVLDQLCAACRPGISTAALNTLAQSLIDQAGATALFTNYRQGAAPPFPGCICASVNDEAVHAIPGPRVLDAGDCVSIDVGLRLGEWCADTARTVLVLPGDPAGATPEMAQRCCEIQRLISATRAALAEAAAMMTPGTVWSSVAMMIEQRAASAGYGVVGEYVGHGIGRHLHEAPQAPCFRTGYAGPDFTLTPGMVLAIEPMFTLSPEVLAGRPLAATPKVSLTPVALRPDGWTVRTLDGSIVSHEEAVISITPSGPLILTGEIGPT